MEHVNALNPLHALRGIEADGVDPQGPVVILDRFWRFEVEWEFPNVVPPVLIYADLLATGDDRCRETAGMVYDKYLAKTIAAD